MKNNNALMNI
jgi:hypothetical protein